MVNSEKVKRKLPSLLVSNCSSRKENKKGWNAYKRVLYRFKNFKSKNPEKYNTLVNKIIIDLSELEKAVNS